MNVFNILTANPLSGNFLKPSRAPMGSPRRVVTTRAVPETLMDKNIIPNNSLSRLRMREKALVKPSMIEDIAATGRKAEDLKSFCLLPV